MTRLVLLLLSMLTALGQPGCAVDPHRDPRPPPPVGPLVSNRNLPWPYWPKSMRVHPLSNLLPEGQLGVRKDALPGDCVYDLYLEFKDQDGIVCRAYGDLEIFLYGEPPEALSEPLMRPPWSFDLTNFVTNRDKFDDVTRTYLWGLKFTVPDLPDDLWLSIYCKLANGTDLYAQTKVRRRDDL